MAGSAADVLNKFDSIHHLVPFYPITDFKCKSVGASHNNNKKKRNLQPLITSHYYFIQGFPQKKPF